MSETTETTIDHDAIRAWALARGGRPAIRVAAGAVETGPVLGFIFGDQGDEWREVEWDDFFQRFDSGRLAMIHGGDADPGTTHKLVSRVEAEQENG